MKQDASSIEDMKNLLNYIKQEHKNGSISDRAYKEMKGNYEKRIKMAEEVMKKEKKLARSFIAKENMVLRQEIKDLKEKMRGMSTEELQNFNPSAPSEEIDEDKAKAIEKKIEPKKIEELSMIKKLFSWKRNTEKKKEEPHAEQNDQTVPAQAAEQTMPAVTSVVPEQATAAPENNEQTPVEQPPASVAAEQPEAETSAAEIQPEAQPVPEPQAPPKEEEKKEGGLMTKIFGFGKKKEESAEDDKDKKESPTEQSAEQPAPEQQSIEQQTQQENNNQSFEAPQQTSSQVAVEIEKMKAVIDSIKETKKSSDETLQNMFESIGEIRSMSFQGDATLKETIAKMERMEDQMNEINPTSFIKKINEINSTLEKHNMLLEKLDTKGNDLSEKINQTYGMLKTIGGIENLMNINRELQQKIHDINEVVKYIERISVKAEKTYLDLNERLGDFVLYKGKQDSLDDSMKDVIKAIDRINLSFENFSTKKDMDGLRSDITLMQTQIQDISKNLPLIHMKLPDDIEMLRHQKEDIEMFMHSLQDQATHGKISVKEYEKIKHKNELKIHRIENELKKDWQKFERHMPSGITMEKPEQLAAEQAPVPPSAPPAAPEAAKAPEAPVAKEDTKEEPKKEPKQKKAKIKA